MLSSKAKITYDPRLRFGRTLDGGGALSVQVGFVVCTNFVGSMSGLPFRMCFAVVDVAHALPHGAVGVFSVPRAAGERALLPNIHLGSAVGRHPFLRFWPAAPDVVSDHIDGLRERNKEEEEEEVQSLEALGNRTETTAQIEIEMTEMPGGTHITCVSAAGKRFTSQYGRPVCQMT